MKHYTYKIINNINNKYYYGIHSTSNLNDGYMGSGVLITLAIEKYGVDNFTKEILEFFPTRNDALVRESELVTMKEVNDPMCYNLMPGGLSGAIKKYTEEQLKEHIREYMHKYNADNKERRKKYNEINKEKIFAYSQVYMQEYRRVNKDRLHEYELANRERHRKYDEQYYEANKERIKGHCRKYYEEHREERNEYNRRYKQNNKERINEYQRKYYAKKKAEKLAQIYHEHDK